MKIGSAQTGEFSIGTVEVRIGPLTEANRLAQSRSIGLVDSAEIAFATTSVDLKGGFPQTIQATAVTEQTGTLKATAREFSRRNLDIMLGNAVSTSTLTEVKTTLANTADVAANAVSITVDAAAGFAVDDIITIYPEGRPEDVTISQISAIAANVITLKTGMGCVVAYPALTDSTRDFHVFKSFGVAAGNVTKTNNLSIMTIGQKNSSGRPVVWSIWKAANSGTMTQSNSATDFASLAMEFKILQPTATDVGVGGDLNVMAPLISLYPSAGYFPGIDA